MVSEREMDTDVAARPRHRGRGWVVLLTVLAAGAVVLTGIWLYAGPYFILEQFRTAAISGDLEAFGAWIDTSALHDSPDAIAAIVRAPEAQFQAGYQGIDRFAVLVTTNRPGDPATLLFRRSGLSWRLSEIQGAPVNAAAVPTELPAPGPRFASLLTMAGRQPSEFITLPDVQERLGKLLGTDLPTFRQYMDTSAGVQVNGNEVFAAGCMPGACKGSEAAVTVDAATGDTAGAILKDGSLVIYSDNITVIEELPKGMQAWLDRLVSEPDAAIPVTFRKP